MVIKVLLIWLAGTVIKFLRLNKAVKEEIKTEKLAVENPVILTAIFAALWPITLLGCLVKKSGIVKIEN